MVGNKEVCQLRCISFYKCSDAVDLMFVGEDGPSQMGLEDLAMFRSIPGSTVFYPSDAVSTERAVELAANTKGLCYIRTSRPNISVLYGNEEEFQIGKAKVSVCSEERFPLVSCNVDSTFNA